MIRYFKFPAYALLFCSALLLSNEVLAKPFIAIVKSADIKAYSEPIEGFKEAIDADEFELQVFNLEINKKKGREVVKTLKEKKPAVIFALGDLAARGMSYHFRSTPIIFTSVMNWQKHKLLKRKNVCGISLDVPAETLLTQFKMAAKKREKIGIIWNESNSGDRFKDIEGKLQRLKLNPVLKPINESSEVSSSLKTISNKADSLWAVADPSVYTEDNFREMVDLTLKNKLAFITYSENFVKAGALFAVSVNYSAIGAQAADFLSQIIDESSNPEEIGIAAPIGSTLVINTHTAEKIGLVIDPFILRQADVIIGKEDQEKEESAN